MSAPDQPNNGSATTSEPLSGADTAPTPAPAATTSTAPIDNDGNVDKKNTNSSNGTAPIDDDLKKDNQSVEGGSVVDKPAYSKHTDPNYVSEEDAAFCLTKMFFTWMGPVLSTGWDRGWAKEEFTTEDLMKITHEDTAAVCYDQFQIEWDRELLLAKEKDVAPDVYGTMKRCFMPPVYFGAIFRLLADATTIAMPFVLREFVKWLAVWVFASKTTELWVGYVWALGLAAMIFFASLMNNSCLYYCMKGFFRMRTVAQLAIFEKALKLAGGHGLTGKIIAMHGADSFKFVENAFFYHLIWASILMTIAALVSLYFFIGYAGVLSIVVIIVMFPPQAVVGKKMADARNAASTCGDKRLTLVNEVLQAIRIVKFMNWEPEFERRVNEARTGELSVFADVMKYRSIFMVFIAWVPLLISFVVFAIAWAAGEPLNPQQVFPTIAMLNILRMPVSMLPLAAMRILDVSVAMSRISSFMVLPERKSFVQQSPNMIAETGLAIQVESATVQFLYTPKPPKPAPGEAAPPPAAGPGGAPVFVPPVPRDLMTIEHVEIPAGKLTLVVGPTAGGKSTLMSVLVGEALVKDGAVVHAAGPMALVAQEAWIMNATVRDNILMNLPFNNDKYIDAVNACELMSDFEQLDASDQTEIGERGINLSGGQKQRIAFARAVYSERDIIIMDDPLSAVDPHVCKNLFDGCIVDALAGKTRVLVTHQTQFLPRADYVIVIADREIKFQGTYDELVESKIDVSTLTNRKRQEGDSDLEDEAEEKAVKQDAADAAQVEADKMKPPPHTQLDPSKNEADLGGASGGTSPSVRRFRGTPQPEGAAGPSRAEADLGKSFAMRKSTRSKTIPPPRTTATSSATIMVKDKDGKLVEQKVKGNLTSTEHAQVGGVGIEVYHFLLKQYGYGLSFFTLLMFMIWRVIMCFADLTLSWWSTRAKVIGYQLTQEQYLYWLAIFTIGTFIFLLLRQIPFVIASLRASSTMHQFMFANVLRAPSFFFDITPVGRILNRFSKDTEIMDLVVPESLNFFVNLVMVLFGAFGIMGYGTPWLLIAIAALLVIFGIIFWYFQQTNRAVKRQDMILRSPVMAVMNEVLGGLATIRSYNMSHAFVEKHQLRLNLSLSGLYTWAYIQRWMSLRVDGTSGGLLLATGLITVAIITTSTLQQQLENLPVLVLGVTYSATLGGAIGYLTTMMADLEANLASVERLKEYTDGIPQERAVAYDAALKDVTSESAQALNDGSGCDPTKPVLIQGRHHNPDAAPLGSLARPLVFPPPSPSWPEVASVEFQDVNLRYRDGLPLVLKGVSFKVEAGQKVGVVGRTGSGKSTIMLSLFRMIELAEEQPGQILLGGRNISTVTMMDLRSKITIIPQDPTLFIGTLRMNLDPLGLQQEADIWSALEKSGMKDRVRKEPAGLDCPVLEKGSNFSVGERQLLCLARAILKNCKLLLLDEATASIDPHQDQILQATIRNEFKTATVLTIAHRLGTIIDADRVLVLDQGVVAEYDAPATLIHNESSVFYSMVEKLGVDKFNELTLKAEEHAAEVAGKERQTTQVPTAATSQETHAVDASSSVAPTATVTMDTTTADADKPTA